MKLDETETIKNGFVELTKAVNSAIPVFEQMVRVIVTTIFPVLSKTNKRVLVLACYAKKKRTRKKNLHRITKELKKLL